MTDNEIRIAIAEKCGWRPSDFQSSKDNPWSNWINGQDVREFRNLPDYPNDLNVMHEVEKQLSEDQYETYCINLSRATGWYEAVNATARQRAEAFCRTLGMWKE